MDARVETRLLQARTGLAWIGAWLCARWPICSWLDVSATNDEDIRSARRRAWALAFFFAFTAFLALRQVDDVLAAMHRSAAGSYRVGDLSDVGFHWPDAKNATAAVDTWVGAADPGVTGPLHLVGWYLIADVIFAVAYTALLVLVLRSAQRMIEAQPAGNGLRGARLTAVRLGIPIAVVLLLTDLVENALIGWLVPVLADKRRWPQRGEGEIFWVLVGVVALKWIFVLVVATTLVAAVAGVLGYLRTQPPGTVGVTRSNLGGFWRTLTALRIPAFAVLLYALFLFGPLGAEQLADVIRRWNSGDDFADGIVALLVTIWLSLVIYVVSWRSLLHETEVQESTPGRKSISSRGLVVLFFLGVALVSAGLALDDLDGLVVVGGILIAFALVGAVPGATPADPGPPGRGGGFLPPLLTVLPLILLGLAVFSAGLSELIYAKRWIFLYLVFAGLAVQYLAWQQYARIRRQFDPEDANLRTRLLDEIDQSTPTIRWHRRAAYASAVVALGLSLWIAFSPLRSADLLGAVGVLAGFSVVLTFAGYAIFRIATRYEPPALFALLGFRQIPILALVTLWLLIATQIDKGGYHDVRPIAYEPAPDEQQVLATDDAQKSAVEARWDTWLTARKLTPGAQTGARKVVPLVLVAAEGGGIRAAFWTADVLDCVIDHAADCERTRRGSRSIPAGSVFAASGVSGGSLGLVAYVARSTSGADADDTTGAWVEKRLGGDYLAPAWARMLFVDTPNALLRLDPEDDRASVLERAWESSWDDVEPVNPLEQGLFSLAWKHPEQPLLLLNGTSVQDGCRVNTSALNGDIEARRDDAIVRLRDCRSLEAFETGTLSPRRESWVFGATHDLRDFLCPNQDVRLSTGALLSARFPYVTPAGRVEHCENKDIAIFVVDGGYFDTSAASPIVELWAELEPHVDDFNRTTTSHCIVPFFLQVDNHYKETSTPAEIKRPSELNVPLTALRSARDARENDARQTAALEFDGKFGPYESVEIKHPGGVELEGRAVKRYAHLYPRAHPGTEAPLGWTLSQASMDDLRTQLVERTANALELDEIERWFDPRLSCVRASG